MIKKIYNEKLITAIVISSIFAFPILEFIGMLFKIEFFLQEEFLSFIGVICTIFTLIYIIFFYRKSSNKKIVLSDIFIILSIFFCIISILFSKNIVCSLTGKYQYSETPLQVLGYFGLFFICSTISNTQNKKNILLSFIVLGLVEALVAFLQNFSLWPGTSNLDPIWHTKDHLAFGFTQHCNYFAPLAIIFTSIFTESFIYSKKKCEAVLALFGSIVCCLSILFTYTRLGWVGLFSILFAVLFLEICIYIKKKDKLFFKNHLKKYSIIFSSFIICFIAVGLLSGQLKSDIELSKKELKEMSSNSQNKVQKSDTYNSFNSFGTGRGKLWLAGLRALKKYPFTGVGFDIYSYSFFLNPQYGLSMQNKGHNEYLHTLVTQGIFSGINYLIFVFYCCFFPLKKILNGTDEYSQSDITKFFLIAVFAYFIQALFNSSVTNVAVYKWILMGLLLTRSDQKNLITFFKMIHTILNSPISISKNK